jgi:hypothetical protein
MLVGISAHKPYRGGVGEIRMEFYFDEKGKLTKRVVDIFVWSL